MTRLISLFIFMLLASTGFSSQKAITDTGEEVILNSDGTWKYINDRQKIANKISTNKVKFKKPGKSTFLLKSTKNNSAYWLDTNKWSFKKGTDDAEYKMQLKGEDLYAMVISEGVYIPVENLADIALANAKSVAPDVEIVKKEYRDVNGIKVIYMEMNGTIQGIKLSYFGYYYSDDAGSTQFLAYTGSNSTTRYESEISDFLNGLTVQ